MSDLGYSALGSSKEIFNIYIPDTCVCIDGV